MTGGVVRKEEFLAPTLFKYDVEVGPFCLGNGLDVSDLLGFGSCGALHGPRARLGRVPRKGVGTRATLKDLAGFPGPRSLARDGNPETKIAEIDTSTSGDKFRLRSMGPKLGRNQMTGGRIAE